MKKIVLLLLVMMIGISLYGIITINTAEFYGSGGVGDMSVTSGETCQLNFNYDAIGSTAPIVIKQIFIKSYEGATGPHYTIIAPTPSFSGIVGTSIDGSVNFTMPVLAGDALNDNSFFVFFNLEDSAAPIAETSSAFTTTTSVTYTEETLPVELSSFDAIQTSSFDGVQLNWTVQSETGLSGYYVYRSNLNDLTSATMIPAFIPSLNVGQEYTYSFIDYEIENNNLYFYWLKSLELNNTFEFFGPVSVTVGNPSHDTNTPEVYYGTSLYDNYPNPFNPTTTISYSVDTPQHVNLSIYNLKGQLVKQLVDGKINEAKTKQFVNWNGTDMNDARVSSGIYFSVMKSNNDVKTNKMILTK